MSIELHGINRGYNGWQLERYNKNQRALQLDKVGAAAVLQHIPVLPLTKASKASTLVSKLQAVQPVAMKKEEKGQKTV